MLPNIAVTVFGLLLYTYLEPRLNDHDNMGRLATGMGLLSGISYGLLKITPI